MKNNYFKTNGNIQVTISGGYLIFVNKEINESIFLHEDEAKFMCKCHVNIRVPLKDVVFIRNCFDTIIKQETIEGDMLQPMVENAVHNAMAKMEYKITPK